MDEEVLEGVRRVVARWATTSTPLIANVSQGDTTISVQSTIRFRVGDEIAILDPETSKGESFLYVAAIVDRKTLRLTTPVLARESYGPAQGSLVVKTWKGRFIQGIYFGDPDVIPMYPAITIMGEDKNSTWLALRTTKEAYKINISVLVEDDNTEDSYRFMLRITKAIERGLKKNIFPLIGPYITTNVTADVQVGDDFIKVSDTSELYAGQFLILENPYYAEGLVLSEVLDYETIQVCVPSANQYLISDDAKIIGITRWFYNSWPQDINYGFKHKGSLLHASQINWFAWETEQQKEGGYEDPFLT